MPPPNDLVHVLLLEVSLVITGLDENRRKQRNSPKPALGRSLQEDINVKSVQPYPTPI